MKWDPAKEPFWAYLIAWVLNLLSGRFVAIGRDEARKEQHEAAEKLEEDYAKNDTDDRTVDDSIGRLRDRAKRRSGIGRVPQSRGPDSSRS